MKRSAMDVDEFDVCNAQIVTLKERFQSSKRKITMVFMIDRVKGARIDHVANVGNLDMRNAMLCQQALDASSEFIGIRHVCEHIIGEQNVGMAPLCCNCVCDISVKKFTPRRNAALRSKICNIAGRIDTQDTGASRLCLSQQVTIV